MDAITELVVELRQEPAPPQRHDPRRSRQNPAGPETDDGKTAT